MKRFFVLVIGLMALGTSSFVSAQSTVSLESFGLSDDETVVTSQPNEDCERNLLGRCISEADVDTSVSFSLSDVVNLGIIDRSELPEETQDALTGRDEKVMVASLPSIDLEVEFDYGSDDIRRNELPRLADLAVSLRELDLDRATLVFMGHTDAVGGAAFNEQLSLRRARSVAEFVTELAGIPQSQVRVSGMGYRFLKNQVDPTAAENRRVQILLVAN